MTVTATQGGATQTGTVLSVLLFSGAASVASQVSGGKTGTLVSGSNAAGQLAITPNATGSVIVGSSTSGGSSIYVANAATTMLGNVYNATTPSEIAAFKSSATTATGTPVTIGSSSPTNGAPQVVLAEILASGTLTEDTANEPAAATSTTATAITTASFTPNPGDLVVLAVATAGGNSGTTTLTITNTGGLAFTTLVTSTASFYGCNAVYVAQMPGGAAPTQQLLQPGGRSWQQRFRRRQAPLSLEPPTVVNVSATSLIGGGSLIAGGTQAAGASLVGTAALASPATQGSPTALVAKGSLAALGTSVSSALLGTGTLATTATEQPGPVTLAAAGSVTTDATLASSATLTGTGVLSAIPGTSGGASLDATGTLSTQNILGESAALTGTGSLIPKGTQAPGAAVDGMGTLAAVGFAIGAALDAAGSVLASSRISPTVVMAGAGSISTAAIQSPALEAFSFGTFPQIPNGSAITSVTVVINEWASSAGMNPASFELWDGTSARIGSTQLGTASTSPYNLDSATFTGVTYSQLATLRVRMYANAGTSVQGDQELANSVSLTVAFTPSTNATAVVAVLKEATVLPAVTTVGQHNATATAGDSIPTFTSFPAVTAGQLSITGLPAVLRAATVFPPVTASGVVNASITVSTLALAGTVVASIVTATSTGPDYAKSADIAAGIGTSVGTWTSVAGVTGPPDASEAVWTRP